MRKNILIIIALAVFSIFNYGCGGDSSFEKKELVLENVDTEADRSEAVFNFLEKSGSFINKKAIPTLISADDVYQNLGSFLVIDIRKHGDYVDGHIDGAINVQANEVLNYFKTVKNTSPYEKVILTCYSGQKASYVTMFLRLLGYNNVYSLKWGMSSWDKSTAEAKWLKNSSSAYINELEKIQNNKTQTKKYPVIKSKQKTTYQIVEERTNMLLEKADFLIKADTLFADPSKYYIINYWPQHSYEKGHIEGAFQFDPKHSLTRNTKLSALPIDKPILLYCYTGQHAAFAVAYLNLLGYEAYSLAYGANAIMHSMLVSPIGHAFTMKEVKNYPLVQGENPSIGGVKVTKPNSASNNTTPMPMVKKKKKKGEEGGC